MNQKMKTPKRFEKISSFQYISIIFFFLMMVWALDGSGFSFSKLFGSSEYIGRFLSEAFPPISEHRLSWNDFNRYILLLIETAQMAIFGTFLGIIVGFLFALMASRGLFGNSIPARMLQVVAKFLITFMRTIPDLVWAIIFVMVVGLGAFAGTLTIAIDTIGFVGRFFAEEMEDVERSAAEGIESSGASKLDSTFSAIIPAAMPGFITTSLFALEKSVRGSVVLGLVGAGGIGMELNSLFNWMAYDRAVVVIGLMFVLILFVEQISSYARSKILDGSFKSRK